MISPKPILTRMILLGLVLGRMAPVRAYDPEDEVNRRARRGEAIGLSTVAPGPAPGTLPGALPDLIALGLARNPGLRSRFEEVKAGLHRAQVVGSLTDPKLTFGVFLESVETRVGPQKSTLALGQFFPLGHKRQLARSRELEAVEALWQDLLARRLKLIEGITQTFHELVYMHAFTRITRENIELLTQLEEVARTSFEVSMGGQMDLIRIQTEIGRLENDLVSRQDQVEPLEARLKSLLAVPTATPLDALVLPDTRRLTLTARDVESQLLEHNPELKSLDEAIDRDRVALKLEKKSYVPDLNVLVQTVRTGEALMPTRDSGKDPVSLMFSVNLPLDRGRLRSQVRAARHRLEGSRQSRQDRENQLKSDLSMALFSLRDAGRRLDLYSGSLLPKAEQAYQVAQTAYLSGVLDFLSVIDTQRTLLEFQRALARAVADQEQARARLEMLTGTLLIEEDHNDRERDPTRVPEGGSR